MSRRFPTIVVGSTSPSERGQPACLLVLDEETLTFVNIGRITHAVSKCYLQL